MSSETPVQKMKVDLSRDGLGAFTEVAFWIGIGCLIYLWDHPENAPIVFNDARSLSQILAWPFWLVYWFFAWAGGWLFSVLGVIALFVGGVALIVGIGWAWSNRKGIRL